MERWPVILKQPIIKSDHPKALTKAPPAYVSHPSTPAKIEQETPEGSLSPAHEKEKHQEVHAPAFEKEENSASTLPYLFEEITRKEADELVDGKPEGTFLLRQRPEARDEYVLVLVARNRPTHHRIVFKDDCWHINSMKLGDFKQVTEVNA